MIKGQVTFFLKKSYKKLKNCTESNVLSFLWFPNSQTPHIVCSESNMESFVWNNGDGITALTPYHSAPVCSLPLCASPVRWEHSDHSGVWERPYELSIRFRVNSSEKTVRLGVNSPAGSESDILDCSMFSISMSISIQYQNIDVFWGFGPTKQRKIENKRWTWHKMV